MAYSALLPSDARRVILHACVVDIPGCDQKRFYTLGNDFCQYILHRTLQDQPRSSGYDHPHIPADFDSEKPLKRWFIYDFNVTGPLTKDQVLELPHEVYNASRQGDNWVFVPRPNYIEEAKSRASSFVWGGRIEQEELSKLKNIPG